MSNPNQAPINQAEVADLVHVDEAGRAHRPNGDFMKNKELALVEAQAAQIQDGLSGFETVEQKIQNDEQVAQKQVEKQQALTSLSDLMEANATLDGPTLTKAGLGFEQRQKLGYGDMDSMKADAEKLLADKQAAKEAEEAQAARTAEAEAHKERGAAQAEAWQQEVNEARAKREAADSRIAELANGTATVKDMTYKEKLENGGELGVQSLVERSKMSAEDAVEAAAAEGLDTGHLKPRYQEVVTNAAAEERAREMGALLDNLTYRASDGSDAKLAERLSDMKDTKARDRILANMRQATAEREAEAQPGLIQRGVERLKAHQAERVKTMIGFFFEVEPATGLEVAEDGTVSRPVEGIKRAFGRLGERLRKARDEVYLRASGIAPERVEDESKEQSKLRGRLVLAGAALGITAVALLTLRHDGGSNLSTLHDAMPKGPKSHDGLNSLLNDITGNTNHGSSHSVTLHSGDNPWTVAQHALGSHASTEQVDQVKDAILQNNHITEAQAHNLATGTQLHMPVELIEKIRSENAS